MIWRAPITILSLAAYALFIASVVAMPLLTDSYSPIDDTISEGALGDYGWVQTLGFFALAAASLGIAWAIYQERESRPAIAVTAGVLAFSTVFTVILALVPTDSPDETTMGGRVHIIAASLAFLVAIASILSAAVTFRGHEVLGALAPWSLLAGFAALGLLLVTGSGFEPSGVWQRATVAVEVLWFVTVGVVLVTAIRQVRTNLRESPARPARAA